MEGKRERNAGHFLGAIYNPDYPPGGFLPDEQAGDWSDGKAQWKCILRNAPNQAMIQSWDGMAILLRGYCRKEGTSSALDPAQIIADLRNHYLQSGELNVDRLDGSFTVALCDSLAGRVILYRNLVGNGFTYYRGDRKRLVFGSNLPEVNRVWGGPSEPNSDAIPSFFLFRSVPGRETLFHDVYRLMPGEEIVWDGRGIRRRIRDKISHFIHSPIRPSEAGECLEKTVAEVLRDGKEFRPDAVNLLSGGVDSSYLQFVWNHFVHQKDTLPRSFSISVDHPHTWPDSDYAMTASQLLGTRHQFVPADQPYSDYLRDAITSTGEPPNHVQSSYFGHLARVMIREGCDAGICGEGADSLFGLGLANQLHNAETLRWLMPTRIGRRLGGQLCALLGLNQLSYTFDLSNRKTEYTWLNHPVNRVATFAHLQSVVGCFGEGAVMKALEQRRELLDQYDVANDPMDRLHAMGFLGEAMDSAGLWSAMFHQAGGDLLCPFLDSRVIRLALNLPRSVRFRYRQPKWLLKKALSRGVSSTLANRRKLGFGQPIFSWLGEGGQLRPMVEKLGDHGFVDPSVLENNLKNPTWFLYSLLVYDQWSRIHLEGEKNSNSHPDDLEQAERETRLRISSRGDSD